MIEEQLPIQIVTLFHPERYLSIPASDLASVPAVNRVRESVEAKRREAARALHVPFVTETFHDRQIINLGTPVEELRNRHVKSIDLLACLRDFDARMIDTSETGSQARYKIEFRPKLGRRTRSTTSDYSERSIGGCGGCEADLDTTSLEESRQC